jgi:hypothetical protein
MSMSMSRLIVSFAAHTCEGMVVCNQGDFREQNMSRVAFQEVQDGMGLSE